MVSDLYDVWFTKSDDKTIRFNHSIFNKAINIEKTSDVLGLMEDFLTKGDPKTEMNFSQVILIYTFNNGKYQQLDYNNLMLKIKIELKVCCPFIWEYELTKLYPDQTKQILMSQLISPLISTVHCLEKRTNYLKQQFHELEDEYKKD